MDKPLKLGELNELMFESLQAKNMLLLLLPILLTKRLQTTVKPLQALFMMWLNDLLITEK